MNPQLVLSVLLAVSVAAAGALAFTLAILKKKCAVLEQRVEQSARELERMQRSFARFAPAELVERIASGGMTASGERRDVTVLFADIRDFTRISETLDPVVLVEILNGYFREMSGVIQSHHGRVTRVMGDGIMSVFGALERNPWHVQDAVEAAVGMREALGRYNQKLHARGLPELRFGIGIHCGVVVAGLVGSDELLEFTVMGDVVNVASRVETLTREFQIDILITEEVRKQLGDRFATSEMPAAAIKGKARPIVTWGVQA